MNIIVKIAILHVAVRAPHPEQQRVAFQRLIDILEEKGQQRTLAPRECDMPGRPGQRAVRRIITNIPIQQTSLLNYINGSDSGSLLSALQSKKAETVSTENRTKYEKQEKAADALTTQIQTLTETGDDSIWTKARTSGDTSAVCTEMETLTECYNDLLSVMNRSTGTLEQFYAKSLRELAEDNSESLSAIGISVKSDGSLSVDSVKLSAASEEKVEKTMGADSTFLKHLSYVSGKISDTAASNLESMTSGYGANGTLTSSYTSKYDFLG